MSNSTVDKVGILGMGDMGAGIAGSLIEHGVRVFSCVSLRSEGSRHRAQSRRVFLRDSLSEVLDDVSIFLSIVPPSAAEDLAGEVCEMLSSGSREVPPLYVDCNAISPSRARSIEGKLRKVGADFADAGIIGPPPRIGKIPRLYVSGKHSRRLCQFDEMGFKVKVLGSEIGEASALKMFFSGLNKGFNALATNMWVAAESMNLGGHLAEEVRSIFPPFLDRIESQIPYLPVNAGRWVTEMEEIANTLSSMNLPKGFHEASAEVFQMLAELDFAKETRETFDTSRTALEVARAGALMVKS